VKTLKKERERDEIDTKRRGENPEEKMKSSNRGKWQERRKNRSKKDGYVYSARQTTAREREERRK
jgi:hypothetical protein